MKKLLALILTLFIVMAAVMPAAASESEEDTRAQIKDFLFEYKDAYNIRDFDAVRDLYTADALIMSFPCNSKTEVFFNEFSESLPRCASYWVDGGFKLRLFKITSFKVDGNKCTARILWDYRDNKGRGKFTPTFDFQLVDGKWKISKEVYGRKAE